VDIPLDLLGMDAMIIPNLIPIKKVGVPIVPLLNKERLYSSIVYSKLSSKWSTTVKGYLSQIRLKSFFILGGWADPGLQILIRNRLGTDPMLITIQQTLIQGDLESFTEIEDMLSQIAPEFEAVGVKGLVDIISTISVPTIYDVFKIQLGKPYARQILYQTLEEGSPEDGLKYTGPVSVEEIINGLTAEELSVGNTAQKVGEWLAYLQSINHPFASGFDGTAAVLNKIGPFLPAQGLAMMHIPWKSDVKPFDKKHLKDFETSVFRPSHAVPFGPPEQAKAPKPFKGNQGKPTEPFHVPTGNITMMHSKRLPPLPPPLLPVYNELKQEIKLLIEHSKAYDIKENGLSPSFSVIEMAAGRVTPQALNLVLGHLVDDVRAMLGAQWRKISQKRREEQIIEELPLIVKEVIKGGKPVSKQISVPDTKPLPGDIPRPTESRVKKEIPPVTVLFTPAQFQVKMKATSYDSGGSIQGIKDDLKKVITKDSLKAKTYILARGNPYSIIAGLQYPIAKQDPEQFLRKLYILLELAPRFMSNIPSLSYKYAASLLPTLDDLTLPPDVITTTERTRIKKLTKAEVKAMVKPLLRALLG
jgi:hypothetical protein